MLHIEVMVESRFTDVGRREVDIALRVGRSRSAVVVEKPAGKLVFGLYASAGYVERRMRSRQLALQDFASHDFVGQDAAVERPQDANLWLASEGATRSLPSCPVFLAYHRDRRSAPGVRAVIEALGAALKHGLR